MYGQSTRNLDEKPVDKEQPQRRLNFVEMKGETESRTAAAQDPRPSDQYKLF